MMQRKFLSLILTLFWISAFSQISTRTVTINENLFYCEIMDSTYVIIHEFPGKCNSMFVLTGNHTDVLIDTPNETSGTKSLLDWIQNQFGDMELIAINTGFHNDNLGGNEYLRLKEIKIYGSGLTARLIHERAGDLKTFMMNYNATAARIMSHKVARIQQLNIGYEMGLGVIQEESINLIGEKPDNLIVPWKPAKLKGV